jgi:adenosylhomocysteine nucleosidase
MIAIAFALRAESAGLAAQLRAGRIDERRVTIVHTGVGRKGCELRIDRFLRDERPDFLISSGFAGGVREDLRAGDLVLAENFSDRQLLSNARRILAGHNVQAAKLFTSTSIIDSAAERNEIARTNGAAAIDMETECVAQVCAAHGVRMLSVRVVSDSVREPFPVPPRILFDVERQKTDFVRLATYLIAHPVAVPGLLRFGKQIRLARKNLTNGLLALLKSELLGRAA